MKEYEEFADINISDIAAFVKDVGTKEIEAEAAPLLVGKQLLKEDRMLVGSPGETREYKKRTATSAAAYGEGDAVPTAPKMVYSTVTSKPEKFGASDTLSSDVIETADFDMINDTKSGLAQAMAEFSDAKVWNELLAAVEVDAFAITNVGGAGTPVPDASEAQIFNGAAISYVNVLEAIFYDADPGAAGVEIPLSDGIEVDYLQGWVNNNSGQTLPWCTLVIVDPAASRHIIGVVGDTEVSYVDVVMAGKEIRASKYKPDTLVVDVESATTLMLDDKFIDADSINEKLLINGQLGKVHGYQMLEATDLYGGLAVVLNRGQKCGYYTMKRPLRMKLQEVPLSDGEYWVAAYEKSNPAVVNDETVCIILNGQPYAYTHA